MYINKRWQPNSPCVSINIKSLQSYKKKKNQKQNLPGCELYSGSSGKNVWLSKHWKHLFNKKLCFSSKEMELALLLSIEDLSRILTLPHIPSFCGLQLLYILNFLFRHPFFTNTWYLSVVSKPFQNRCTCFPFSNYFKVKKWYPHPTSRSLLHYVHVNFFAFWRLMAFNYTTF